MIDLAVESGCSKIKPGLAAKRMEKGCLIRHAPSELPRLWRHSTKENVLLTESTVESMFRKLMNDPKRGEEVFEKAEELLEEELRPESPLRHRLSVELEELRSLIAKT